MCAFMYYVRIYMFVYVCTYVCMLCDVCMCAMYMCKCVRVICEKHCL